MLPRSENVLDNMFRERKKVEREGGKEGGKKEGVMSTVALNYQEMCILQGRCRGSVKLTTLEEVSSSILLSLNEGGELLVHFFTKLASNSQCCSFSSVSSATLRSSMCCQCLSDFPNKEIRLPLGFAETF